MAQAPGQPRPLRLRPAGTGAPSPIRWRLTSDDAAGALFSDEVLVERHVGRGEYRTMEFIHVNARRLINRVPEQSRVPFRHTINPYRGCSHACVYCFARPTHEYLGLGLGEDFERRIVVKVNAVERLEAELRSARFAGEHIAMGTNTDPYQKAEGKYHLTRGIVEVLGRHANPFSILTKSTLVLRDVDVLLEAQARTTVRLAFSIGTLDRDVWRLTEPGTPPPDKRVDALRTLTEAGFSCSVLVAPILPGLSDGEEQLEAVARACVDAGAESVSPVALHLRPGLREHYLGWLARTRPELAELYARRFGRGAYQPADEQRRVCAVVEAAVQAAVGAAVGAASNGARRRPRTRRPGRVADSGDGRFVTGHEAALEAPGARTPPGSSAPAAGCQARLF